MRFLPNLSNARSFGLFTLLSLLLYANTLGNDYALDDEIVTGPTNITAEGLSSVKAIFTDWYQNEMGNKFDYRPLVKLSFALENQFFGLSPGIHHFFNILYYGLCCWLLFIFLSRLFDGNKTIAFISAVLFLFHPAHTEVVASLKNRDIMLVFIFSLLAGKILLDLFGKKEFALPKFLLVILLFYLATLSKRDALVFVLIFPPLIFLKHRPKISRLALIVGIIAGCYVLMLLTAKVLVPGSEEHRAVEFFENPVFSNRKFFFRISALFNCSGFYFLQNFFPAKLVSYYGYNHIDVLSPKTFWFAGGIIGWAGWAFFFLRNWKNNFMLSSGLVFIAGGMLLYLNFVRPVPGIVADRFTFVSSIGASILLSLLILKIFKTDPRSVGNSARLPSPAPTIFILISFACFFLGFRRNSEWKNRETLFAADVKKAPRSAKLHSLYALELIHQYRANTALSPPEKAKLAETAISELRKSLEIYPDYDNSQSNLAYMLLSTSGDAGEAKGLLEKALRKKPGNAEIRYNYADALYRTGEYKRAEEELITAIGLKKDLKTAYDLLVEVSWKNGSIANSIKAHKEALKSGMKEEFVYLNLGNSYARLNDTLNAVLHYDSALTLNPVNKNLGKFLYGFYVKKGMSEQAERIKNLFGK